GEGGFHDFGGDPQRGGQIVAVIHVETDRLVVGVAHAHRRKVQHHRTAQLARGDDVVKLVGQRRRRDRSRRNRGRDDRGKFHVVLHSHSGSGSPSAESIGFYCPWTATNQS